MTSRLIDIKKIALPAPDIRSALSASITVDHFFTIGMPLWSYTWNRLGYQGVFLFGMLIAVITFCATKRIKIPERSPGSNPASEKRIPDFKRIWHLQPRWQNS